MCPYCILNLWPKREISPEAILTAPLNYSFQSNDGKKGICKKTGKVVNPSEGSFDYSACSLEMQFASFSPSVKKTCSLAETMSQAECHTARVWLSEECQAGVGSCRGGSCLPLSRWTKVPSRCSGIQSSIWIKPIWKWTGKWLISWVISVIVTFRSKWLLSISGSCIGEGGKKSPDTMYGKWDEMTFMRFSFRPV